MDIDPQALAPIAKEIGAIGTATIVGLILAFKLAKHWMEYRKTKAEATRSIDAESDVETLLEIVADDEEEDAQLIERVDSITGELAEIREELDRVKRDLEELQ